MARLTKQDKRELLAGSLSARLRSDCRRLSAATGKAVTVKQFIDFVTQFNEFIGNKPKAFKRITGTHFYL